VTLSVTDIERSREFYQNLFGAPLVSKQAGGINLAMGPVSFLGLYKMGQAAPSIHHVCLGVEGGVESAAPFLEKHGVKPQIRDRDGVKELYFRDPDNIMIQLQEPGYRG
jgi:catechol 2,3-dioxygenase-like lactoylglutathione lyase family enzyme